MITFSFVVFTIYWILIGSVFGVQKSISETARTLKRHRKGYEIFFFLWGMLFLFPLLGAVDLWVFNIAIMLEGLLFAAYAFWKHPFINRWHLVGSYGGIALGLVASGIMVVWWYPLIVLAVFGLIRWRVNHYIWWVEVVAYYAIVVPVYWG